MENEQMLDSGRRGRTRWALAALVVAATLAALTIPAGAWIRARSDISIDAEALAVCSSEVTLSSTLAHQIDSFEFSYPDFVGVPDVTPYPGLATEFIELYGSSGDALARTNAVVTVEVPRIYRSQDTSVRFSGEATVPTPAGFDNGDTLYASGFDSTLSPVAVPLTIGDPVYDCAPEYLPWAVLSAGNTVQVNAYLPHTILFDASSVSPKSLTVSNGGQSAPVQFLGQIGSIGVARVDLNDAGLRCNTTTLVLSGVDAGGYEHLGEIKVFPKGRRC